MEAVVTASLEQIHSTNVKDQEHALRILINSTLNGIYFYFYSFLFFSSNFLILFYVFFLLDNVRKEVVSELGTLIFIDLLQSPSDVVVMLSAWLLSHIAIDGNILFTFYSFFKYIL